MKNNFSKYKTPETNQDWVSRQEKERIEIIYRQLQKEEIYRDFEVTKAYKKWTSGIKN